MKSFFFLFLLITFPVFAETPPINTTCPVTPGEPIEEGYTLEYEGQILGFCCSSCVRKFRRNPEAYLANLRLETQETGTVKVSEPAHGHETDHATASPSEPESDHASTSASEPEHDHATDHASKTTPSWLIFLSKFHVLVIHFPIALLPLSALLEFFAILGKKPMLRQAAWVQFVLGALGAIVAATLGWILALNTHPEQALQQTLFLHRWGGVGVAVLSALGLLFLVTSKRFPEITPKLYKVVLVLLLVLVPVTAHFGGTLVYGLNYFTP